MNSSLDASELIFTTALASVTERVALARRGSPIRLILEGERGIGKSTAINHALDRHAAIGEIIVLKGSADQFRTPFSPLAEAFSCLLESNIRNDRLKRIVAEIGGELLRLVPFVGTLGGYVKEIYSATYPESAYPASETSDLIYRIQKTVRRLSQHSHALFVFTDINQYDFSSLSVLSQLARKVDIDSSYIFTVDPFAPLAKEQSEAFLGFESELMSGLGFRKIQFKRFTPEQTAKFLALLLGTGVLTEQQSRSLHDKTGGNPLFLRELATHLVDEGYVVGRVSHRFLAEAYSTLTLPESIRALIKLRIERLPAELRDIINLASVIGIEFYSEPLSEGLRLAHLSVLDRLRKLEVIYNLIEQMDRTHRFSLEAIRDAVYESLGNALAREHHLILARYFEKHPEYPDVDYLIYYHYDRALMRDEAFRYLIKSAYSARLQISHEEAAHRFRIAREMTANIVKVDETESLTLWLEEAVSQYDAGEFNKALGELTRIAAEKLPVVIKANVLLNIALSQYLLDKPDLAIMTLSELLSKFLDSLTDHQLLRAKLTQASVLYALSRWNEARGVFRECIKALDRYDSVRAADVLKRVNMFYLPELALPMLQKAKSMLEDARNLPLYWEIHHNIGGSYLLMGDFESAAQHFSESLHQFDRMSTYRISYPMNNLGLVYLFQGKHRDARRLFEQVDAIARVDFDQISAKCHLAVIDCLEGRPRAAIPILESLRDKVRDMSELILKDLVLHNLAWSYMLAGLKLEAAECLRSGPVIIEDLWSHFRVARKRRLLRDLEDGSFQKEPSILEKTGRRDSWSFKILDYEVNDLWFWE